VITPADGQPLPDGSTHYEVLIPKHRQLTVFEGETVTKGEVVSEGPSNPLCSMINYWINCLNLDSVGCRHYNAPPSDPRLLATKSRSNDSNG